MHITVSEWMRAQLIEDENIKFIETLILSSSSADSGQVSANILAEKINSEFPIKTVKLSDEITYEEFKNNILANKIQLDVRELIVRYSEQGLCKELCQKLISQSKI